MLTWIIGLTAITWLFWLIVGLEVVVALVACKNESDTPTFFASLGAAIVAVMYGPKLWAMLNWQWLLAGLVGYFIIATLFAFYRWSRWVYAAKDRYNRTDKGEGDYETLMDKTDFSQHKAELYRWIMFWPFSMAVNLFDDIFDGIYNSVKETFEKITRHALRDVVRPEPYKRPTN